MATIHKASGGDSKIVVGGKDYPDAKVLRVTIPATEQDTQPVQIGLNFKLFLIPRDQEVLVVEPLIDVLRAAVQKKYKNQGGELIEYDAPTYPYQVLGEA
ncbi:hypothetical protein [Chitinilyticum litopenaei]|uniref:hypothetical protein n=1 Tax=Chitinilyticum litopenaei TaxID=1121276 RepID=UPI00041034EE|nr:hypothetical protein [Chitinilyticum litopenaei]